MSDTAAHRPHFVYRLFDADGVLLYIGCSVNVEQRLSHHRSQQPWFSRVASKTVEGPFPDRKTGRAAEDRYIDDERPLFAMNSRQVGEAAAASTHRVGPDGMTSLTRANAGRREARESREAWTKRERAGGFGEGYEAGYTAGWDAALVWASAGAPASGGAA